MFCMFPDSKSEWKKWATGQSFIRKENTTYRIGTLNSKENHLNYAYRAKMGQEQVLKFSEIIQNFDSL